MKINYVCSICGKENVKLWRPCLDIEPLICSECAERLQVHQFSNNNFNLKQLPVFEIDDYGNIPSVNGPIDKFHVCYNNNDGFCESHMTHQIYMVPACLDENGFSFFQYNSIPKTVYEWWKNLPTR